MASSTPLLYTLKDHDLPQIPIAIAVPGRERPPARRLRYEQRGTAAGVDSAAVGDGADGAGRQPMSAGAVVRVAVPVPLFDTFDYRWTGPDARPAAGCRVRVPFGRHERIGIVVGHPEQAAVADSALKAVSAVLDPEPVIDAELLATLEWCAGYYHHPLGEVLIHALPAMLRRGGPAAAPGETFVELTAAGAAADLERLARRAPRQAGLLEQLRRDGPLPRTVLLDAGFGADTLRRLADRDLIATIQRRDAATRRPPESDPADGHGQAHCGTRASIDSTGGAAGAPATAGVPAAGSGPTAAAGPSRPTLTPAQAAAVDAIRERLDRFAPFLLFGVTGSGKTEVFLRLIEDTLAAGRQTLLLVPEISLTPQLVGRLTARFGESLAVLHSGLADGERLNAWRAARAGSARLIVGTRSAVFCPLPNPGLVIVDEEHDPSFKQQTGLRYSARDLAIVRARAVGVPVVLASATPSLESFRNAREGRYTELKLPTRIGSAGTPRMHVVDMNRHASRNGLSTPLIAHLERHLGSGGQVLLFINRRGFAPVLYCPGCETVEDCPRCDAHLTIHARAAVLRCHHCGREEPLHWACPRCSHERIALGEGTQRITDELATLFPDQAIARLDRDALTGREALGEILGDVESGRTRIIVGTQLLAKGHDFPGVTLVGVLNADQGLFGTDFRAEERLAQTLVQVAGRAGRREQAGDVVVQTHFPRHPLLKSLLEQDYAAFATAALAERAASGWPPYSHVMLWRAEATGKQAVFDFLGRLKTEACRHAGSVAVLGPTTHPLERVGGRFRGQLLLQATNRSALHSLAQICLDALKAWPQTRRVRWALDVDPIEL